jgi:hypothetical protein
MPIIDLQRRIHEAGRIRIGQQISTGQGKTRPTKLDTFRLTSPNQHLINQVATLYGGTPAPWDAPAGPQYEVITTTDRLPVLVPPTAMAFSQHYELWSAAGCARRCDGANETISDGPCLCDPDNRECQIHTRLSIMLRDLPGLGVWRIDSQGYNAAVELQGAVHIINLAAEHGQLLPAVLRLEHRMTKRPGQGTHRFAVPVLDIEVSPAQLLTGHTQITDPAVTPNGHIPALTPVPADTRLGPSIAAQAGAEIKTSRRALPVPATGLTPRTVTQAATDLAEPPDEPVTITTHLADEPDEPITKPQNAKLHALFRELGITNQTDRHLIRDHILGYHPETQLTKTEAHTLIDTTETWLTDQDYAYTDHVNDILNEAALRQAAENEPEDN